MIDNKPRDNCACWREKKVMSSYCIRCWNEINTLRGKIKNTVDKNKRLWYENLLLEKLNFHWTAPIKTKTTKMREKRVWLSKGKE